MGVAEHNAVRSNFNKTSGKWYFEVTIDSGTTHFVGVGTADTFLDSYAGGDEHAYTYHDLDGEKYNDGSGASYGDTYAVGDVIGIALDLDNQKIFFSKNGAWQDSGDPVVGTDYAFTIPSTRYYAIWSGYDGGEVTANFGDTDFVHVAPSGFRPFGDGWSSIIWDSDHMGDGSNVTTKGGYIYDPPIVETSLNDYGDIFWVGTVQPILADSFLLAYASVIANYGRIDPFVLDPDRDTVVDDSDTATTMLNIYYFEVEVTVLKPVHTVDSSNTPTLYVGLSANTLDPNLPLSVAPHAVSLPLRWEEFTAVGISDRMVTRVGVMVDYNPNAKRVTITYNGVNWFSYDISNICHLELFPAVTMGTSSDSRDYTFSTLTLKTTAQLITENFTYNYFSEQAGGIYAPRPWADISEDANGAISETTTTSDEIIANVEYGQPGSFIDGEISESFTTDDDNLATLPGDSGDPQSGTSGEEFTMSDSIEADTPNREIGENVVLSDSMECDTPYRDADESVTLLDTLSGAGSEFNVTDAENVEVSAEILGGFLQEAAVSEGVSTDDAFSIEKALGDVFQSEMVTMSDAIAATKEKDDPISESAFIFDTLGWTWIKPLTSEATITDTVEIEVGISVTDYLTAQDTIITQWAGVENVESTLNIFGNALIAQIFNESIISTADAVDAVAYLHKMISAVESSMNAADAVSSKATFNPLIAESIAVAGTISVLKKLYPVVAETADITDAAQPGWLKAIVDGATIEDTAIIQMVAMHILTDSLEATDTAIGLFNFTDTISDTFEAVAAATIQQLIQESIEDILHFGITITLDGDVWSCWVINGNAFNMSIYSGFGFNSYATYNNQAFGCRADGIYRLDGDTDDGNAFHSGVVLPETNFGTTRNKRFRKAWFGMSGSSPSIRMETESGDQTYTITNSRANLSRSQKGKNWTVKIQDFDDIEHVDLIPIILTR